MEGRSGSDDTAISWRCSSSDQGGHEAVSEAVRAIIRRASALCVELERLEMLFASAGEATPQQLELHGRTSNTLRRLLEAVAPSASNAGRVT